MLVNMSEVAHHSEHGETHQMPMPDMSMDHKQSHSSTHSKCESDHECGVCMMHFSAALISEIAALDIYPQFSFELNDHIQDALSTHSRLLRPPKFS